VKLLLLYIVASKISQNSLVYFALITTVNKELRVDIFRFLKDAVRKRRPENWRTNSWFLLHDNAPAHRSGLVRDFLPKNNVKTLETPLYCPDLDPDDFTCSLDYVSIEGTAFL
jgi:hypothetical protein